MHEQELYDWDSSTEYWMKKAYKLNLLFLKANIGNPTWNRNNNRWKLNAVLVDNKKKDFVFKDVIWKAYAIDSTQAIGQTSKPSNLDNLLIKLESLLLSRYSSSFRHGGRFLYSYVIPVINLWNNVIKSSLSPLIGNWNNIFLLAHIVSEFLMSSICSQNIPNA